MTETRRLYYEDVYKKEFTATVLECRERKNGFAVILDESAFYPDKKKLRLFTVTENRIETEI